MEMHTVASDSHAEKHTWIGLLDQMSLDMDTEIFQERRSMQASLVSMVSRSELVIIQTTLLIRR